MRFIFLVIPVLSVRLHRDDPSAFEPREIPYVWNVGPWSDCSGDCDQQVRIRTITCIDGVTAGVLSDESFCFISSTAGPKPESSEPCPPKCLLY